MKARLTLCWIVTAAVVAVPGLAALPGWSVTAAAESGADEKLTAPESLVEGATPVTTTPRPRSARLARRLTVSGVLNFPILNGGVDVSYHLTDRLAIGGQLTSMVIHNELSARLRYFFVAAPSWGLYLGVNALLIHSPLILSFPAAGATGELGFEIRRHSWVVGFGAGAGAVWSETAEGMAPGEHWQAYPVVNFRIGRAYQ